MQELPDPHQPSSPLPARPEVANVYGPEPMDSSDETGLLEYWQILRRRKGTVLLIAGAACLLAILITLPQTKIFQAKTTLEIQDVNQDFMNMKNVSPESQTYSALADIQTQIKILQSDTLASRTIEKLKSAKNPSDVDVHSRVSSWRSVLQLPEPKAVDARDAALKAAAKSLKVRSAGQTRIIEVLVDSPDPRLAASFANTLTSEFIDQNMEARWKMSQRTAEWLGRQMEDMRIKLEHSEDALQAYARQAGLIFTGEKTNVSEEKLRQLQEALTKASSERVAKQSRYEMATTSSPETLPDVLSDTSLGQYQVKLADLRSQIADLSATFTPEYPKVKRLQAQVQAMESALDRERTAIIGRIKNEYDEAVRREKLLADAYSKQVGTVTGESERAIQYNILKREVDSNRQLYDAMLQRLKESSIASAMKASNVRVVDAADPPEKPYKPSLPMNAALGLFGGGFLGITFVIMQERADRTLQAPGDAPFWLNVPELGVIPNRASAKRRSYYYGGRSADTDVEPALTLENGDQPKLPQCVELTTLQQKPSIIAEAFRTVLTCILFSGSNGTRPRVLVLTSASPGEGKTTVVCNLAIAMVEIGRRVLLVDADLRKPRIHTIFGLENQRGLADLLRSKSIDDEMLHEVIQETSVPGLHVLPSGPPTSAAANLLFAGHMSDLLARFKSEFDMVLIDTPPMLTMPDARVLGRIADCVLMVHRAGKTTRDAAAAAHKKFSEDQTRVLGTVLNDWDPKTSPNGYYGYHGKYHLKY